MTISNNLSFSRFVLLSGHESVANFKVVNVDGGGGEGVQDLLIPPTDSGFETELETKVLASVFAD